MMIKDIDVKSSLPKKDQDEPKPFFEFKYKFNSASGEYEYDSYSLSDGSKGDKRSLLAALKRLAGSNDPKVSQHILNKIVQGMSAESSERRINETCALMPALKPKDETEALIIDQFLVLQDSGMKCLRNANLQAQGFYHQERLLHLANKLFNTANQTMQTLLKYRNGGQQTVQVVHIHNEGQAIVAQNLSSSKPGEGIQENSKIEPHGS